VPKQNLRHVRRERAAAWERAGWKVISQPLQLWPPPGLEGHVGAAHIVIVEWVDGGSPVEPAPAE